MKNELLHVDRSLIDFGERYREDYGDLSELAHSIKQRGLIQPLAVRTCEDGRYLLLAGGRRFKASEIAGLSSIPVHIYPGDLSEFERRAIELAENLYRKDMTWQEDARLKKEVHDLYTQEYGSGSVGGWTMEKTGELVGASKATMSRDLALAQKLESRPDLAALKSKKEAIKVLADEEERLIREELARRARAKAEASGTFSVESSLAASYIVKDFFDGVRGLDPGIINLVELDPDWGIDVSDFRSAPDSEYHEVEREGFLQHFERVITECDRVMSSHSWCICWYPFEHTGPVMQIMRSVGWTVSATPGVWAKDDCTHNCRSPQFNLDPQCEIFLVARKGSPVMARPARASLFQYKRLPAESKIHPLERPNDLITDLLSTFTFPGSRVLVPFLGSGKTLLCAHNLGMHPIGFDLSRAYKDAFVSAIHQGGYEWTINRK